MGFLWIFMADGLPSLRERRAAESPAEEDESVWGNFGLHLGYKLRMLEQKIEQLTQKIKSPKFRTTTRTTKSTTIKPGTTTGISTTTTTAATTTSTTTTNKIPHHNKSSSLQSWLFLSIC